jgi:cytoskeleton protein RodZ
VRVARGSIRWPACCALQRSESIGVHVDQVAEPDGSEGSSVGMLLRVERERQGLTVESCAAELKARREQLLALETDRFEVFGGDIYARAFIRSYARLLGLDAAPLLELHGSDPAFAPVTFQRAQQPVHRERRVPGLLLVLLGVVVVGASVLAVITLGGSRTPPVAAPIEVPVTATPTPAPAPAPGPAPAPEPPPAPVVPPVDLVLTIEATSWLEVVADDVVVEPGRLARPGETLRYLAQERIAARFGNAGGVRAELNGIDLGPQGRSGAVERVTYGPDGVID